MTTILSDGTRVQGTRRNEALYRALRKGLPAAKRLQVRLARSRQPNVQRRPGQNRRRVFA